jgi:flavin reductase (DIM6/NTAB) family NADH-FMN oxidoreductase RutF
VNEIISTIAPDVMRHTMGGFATGVAVVITQSPDGQTDGMTVNSLTSVSLDPPLLLVSFMKNARTGEAIIAGQKFSISVLGSRQHAIALRFAKRGVDHFEGLPLTYCSHAVPVVPGAIRHLECVLEDWTPMGDHNVVYARVIDACQQPGKPLVFSSGRFGDFASRDDVAEYWQF